MNSRPLVSVVVPAYNGEKVLAEALTSIQKQTYPHYEVIVVDDGSTDRTSEVASRFAESDPRFKLFRQANAGSAVARNTALKHATGEWVAFLDADDLWLPTKLEAQIRLAESDPRANLVFTNYWIWNGDEDRFVRYTNPEKFPERDVPFLYRGNVFGTSTVMVSRKAVDRAGGFDPELRSVQDWALWLRIAENELWARGVWEPQARYRIWSGNITADRVRNATYAVQVMEKALKRDHPADRRRVYRRGLRMARARLELARAQVLMKDSPAEMPRAVLRAWQSDPSEWKWLFRYLGLIWPVALGGSWTSRSARRKIEDWRAGWRQQISEGEAQKLKAKKRQ